MVLYIKATHIVFIVTWFAGLFYLVLTFILVRLFKLAERRWLAYMAPRKG